MKKNMRTLNWMMGALLIAATLLTACQPNLIPEPNPTPMKLVSPTAIATAAAAVPTVAPTVVPEPAPRVGVVPVPEDEPLKGLVAAAKADLAQRLTIPAAQIDLVEASSVTWSDGSLGCPKPGMMYTQALVGGALIRLRVGETVYEYHNAGKNAPFYCEKPSRALPAEDEYK